MNAEQDGGNKYIGKAKEGRELVQWVRELA
jgi:hypothetical protein